MADVPPPDERKTDYFATFLDVLGSGATQVSSALSSRASQAVGGLGTYAGGAAPSAADYRDQIVRDLASMGGKASVQELLAATDFNSLGQIIPAVQELQTFGLTILDGGVVRLTSEGEKVAALLGTARADAA